MDILYVSKDEFCDYTCNYTCDYRAHQCVNI
jgi:hypothetical protein